MKKLSVHVKIFIITGIMLLIMTAYVANAEETLRYSCSAQVFEAFGMDRLKLFTKETGIKVDLYTSTSGSAVYRLMNGFSDIASTTRRLYYRYKENGYVEIPFCKDPLAIIVNTECKVENISQEQLREIFCKHITNWKEIGGLNQSITIVVPGKETGAYKNFERLAMGLGEDILYDYMTYQSTKVIEAVEHFPNSISFIAQGDIANREKIKTLKINGISPRDKNYPYFQTFYYITKGEPTGSAKKFIDFTMSEKGMPIMKEKGILPIVSP